MRWVEGRVRWQRFLSPRRGTFSGSADVFHRRSGMDTKVKPWYDEGEDGGTNLECRRLAEMSSTSSSQDLVLGSMPEPSCRRSSSRIDPRHLPLRFGFRDDATLFAEGRRVLLGMSPSLADF